MKYTEILALKSNDFLDEVFLDQRAWTALHSMRNHRKDILKLILPASLYESFEKEQESVRKYVFYQLSHKINEIIQDNFFFLIENNIGNMAVIEDLFDQVAKQLTKYKLLDEIDTITVKKSYKNHYFEMLKLASTGYTIVKSAQASWLYLTFCLWLRRIIAVAPHHFVKLVPMVRQAYPFFVFVLRDAIVLEHRKHVEMVRVSSK